MKKSIVLFCSVIVALMGYSCSSDDNSSEENNLIGEWQLEAVDFSFIDNESFNGGVHPIYKTDFCVMEYIAGYTFKEDGSFIFIVTGDKFRTNSGVTASGEQIWNWEGHNKSFTIEQPNPAHTNGYVFAPKTIYNRNVEKIGKEWRLTFEADLHLGSKATFTFVKKEIDKVNHRPALTENNKPKETCKLLDR